MWRRGAPSPIRRGEISELQKSPGGSVFGRINAVDTEELFPLNGYRFSADRQVYPDVQPFLVESLPVTFEPRPGGQADNVGVDFSRLQQGTLEVFNGRSGWIRDSDREVYFERSNLMNSSRQLEASKTKVSYFAGPHDDDKALLVYPDGGENDFLHRHRPFGQPPFTSRSPSPFTDEDERGSSRPQPFRRLSSLSRNASSPAFGLSSSYVPLTQHIEYARAPSPSPFTSTQLPSAFSPPSRLPPLSPLPPVPPNLQHTRPPTGLPSLTTSNTINGTDVNSGPRSAPVRARRLANTRSHANFGVRRASTDPSLDSSAPHLRRVGSHAMFATESAFDPFEGSEGFERMPKPLVKRGSMISSREREGLPQNVTTMTSSSTRPPALFPRAPLPPPLPRMPPRWKDNTLDLFPA